MPSRWLAACSRVLSPLLLFLLLLLPVSSAGAENWPQFRGPDGAGVSGDEDLPYRWNEVDNVAWKTNIPGRGWSSPILWKETIFLTSAISSGDYKEPSTGIYGNDYAAELAAEGLSDEEVLDRVVSRDIELSDETEGVSYMVYAIDAETGSILWEREAHQGKPFGGRHRKNTYASETPVTDGERVYALFGNVGLFCYSMDGRLLWKQKWAPQKIYLDFGTAASPVVHGDRVVVQSDNDGESFIAAVDKSTGTELWRTKRDMGESFIKSGWSSPFVWKNDRRTEIVALGRTYAVSYDMEGKELWRLGGLTGQATPTAVAAGELLILGTGSQGESNRPMFAVRPGAEGDISLKESESSNEFVAWRIPRASAYTPSPLVYEGRVYVVNDNGILAVYDVANGQRLYRARVGGGGHTFSSSPWAYDGKIFFLSEDGDTFVIESGKAYEEIAKNPLNEMSFASPAVGDGGLFIRTATKLYRISQAVE